MLKGNALVLRFVNMKPIRVPVDELTREAREWLLPSLAPREIELPGFEEEQHDAESPAGDDDEVRAERTDEARRTR